MDGRIEAREQRADAEQNEGRRDHCGACEEASQYAECGSHKE
jgi:hypothetical protein